MQTMDDTIVDDMSNNNGLWNAGEKRDFPVGSPYHAALSQVGMSDTASTVRKKEAKAASAVA
jgi:hypothetical protein